MNKELLTKLADMLEADASNAKGMSFNMYAIGKFTGDKPSISCNTSGCGMGFAAISGEFPRLGFEIEHYSKYNEVVCTVDGKQCYYIEAAMKVFDVTQDQARRLFDPECNTTDAYRGRAGELALVKRIRKMVETEH